MNEEALIDWLRRRPGTRGLGDDAAILPAGEEWAVTMDSQIAGVHFVPDLDPKLIARRLLRVNLSDLASMGASPAFAFLSLSAPGDWQHKDFLRAITRECKAFGVELAGGDLSSQKTVTLTLTLLGRRRASGRWLRRDLGRPGDRLWLGGTLGESALGCRLMLEGARMVGRRISLPETDLPLRAARRAVRRHLLPTPQLELGLLLAQQERCAAIDLSDGFAKDLTRLCRESGVGARVMERRLPLPQNYERLAIALGEQDRAPHLYGGEDYILLFALAPEMAPPAESHCYEVGRLTKSRHILLIDAEDRPRPLRPDGWDHLQKDSSTTE